MLIEGICKLNIIKKQECNDPRITYSNCSLFHSFTLIELLVVVAIIAVLVSILLPSLNLARELSRSLVCLSQLRTIGQGVLMYAQEENDMLPYNNTIHPLSAGTAMPQVDYSIPKMNVGSALFPTYIGNRHVFYCPSYSIRFPPYREIGYVLNWPDPHSPPRYFGYVNVLGFHANQPGWRPARRLSDDGNIVIFSDVYRDVGWIIDKGHPIRNGVNSVYLGGYAKQRSFGQLGLRHIYNSSTSYEEYYW